MGTADATGGNDRSGAAEQPQQECIHTRIWQEQAEPDNPFAAAVCRCHGYDVYGDLLGRASWAEYLYLLFFGERPAPWQGALLNDLAVALANPGIRDHSVRAAMNAGVGRSTAASTLMAALAVGAGNLGGGREVFLALAGWRACGTDLAAWRQHLLEPPVDERADIWPAMEHPPGFDPHGVSCATPVRQTLARLAGHGADRRGSALAFLHQQRPALEETVQRPLAMSGVAAAALWDLAATPEQGEMLYLLLRLPGAAVHGLEQRGYGWRRYPFFRNGLVIREPESAEPAEASDG